MTLVERPKPKDSTEIGLIMQKFPEWEKQPKPKWFPIYKSQRYWKRIKVADQSLPDGFVEIEDDDPLQDL